MWNRLKNTLTAAALSTALVLGLAMLAQPSADSLPVAAERIQLDADALDEQAVYRMAVQLAAAAIDAAVEANSEAVAEATNEQAEASARPARSGMSRSTRMPFYSFGSRQSRVRGS